jgi:hypothetical protein
MILATLVFVIVLYRGDSYGKEVFPQIDQVHVPAAAAARNVPVPVPTHAPAPAPVGATAAQTNTSAANLRTSNHGTTRRHPDTSSMPIGTDAMLAAGGIELDAIYANVEVIPSASSDSVEMAEVRVIMNNPSSQSAAEGEVAAAVPEPAATAVPVTATPVRVNAPVANSSSTPPAAPSTTSTVLVDMSSAENRLEHL